MRLFRRRRSVARFAGPLAVSDFTDWHDQPEARQRSSRFHVYAYGADGTYLAFDVTLAKPMTPDEAITAVNARFQRDGTPCEAFEAVRAH